MEARLHYIPSDSAQAELCNFVNEGLQDILNGKLLDFDTTFDELEERFGAND